MTGVRAVPVLADAEETLAVAAEFATGLATGDSERDANRVLPHTEIAALAASGLLGVNVPARFGGADVAARTMGELMATLSAGDASVGQIPQNHYFFVQVLTEAAGEEQQAFFAAEVLAGRHFGNALSERGTRTVRDFAIGFEPLPGGDVRIDGTKYYATGSPFAPWIPIYANDPDGRIVAAWVPADAPGVTVVDDWVGMGQRTTGSGTVRFDQVVIPARWVVPIWTVFERPEVFGAFGNYLHAGIDLGIADAALRDGGELIRTLSRPRPESEAPTAAEDPLVIHGFGELALQVRAARALLHDAGDAIDAARRDPHRGQRRGGLHRGRGGPRRRRHRRGERVQRRVRPGRHTGRRGRAEPAPALAQRPHPHPARPAPRQDPVPRRLRAEPPAAAQYGPGLTRH